VVRFENLQERLVS
jgi:hypothetical protein